MRDALFHPKYRKATWINLGYITFHELTGTNAIAGYSTQIFFDLKKDDNFQIVPRYATIYLGIAGLIASTFSLWFVR